VTICCGKPNKERSMTKRGDQFLMHSPLSGERVIVCAGKFSGMCEFVEFHDGKPNQDISVTFPEDEIEKGGGCFNLRPIDESHPAYIKDWEKVPKMKLMGLLERASHAEENGEDPDKFMGDMIRGLHDLASEAQGGEGEDAVLDGDG
jgi:hypothetical protein